MAQNRFEAYLHGAQDTENSGFNGCDEGIEIAKTPEGTPSICALNPSLIPRRSRETASFYMKSTRPPASVCVVGDDDQTIYQWRESDVRNILSFEERYPKVKQVRLEENFRSSEAIVAVACEFIRQVVRRLPKEMKATAAQIYEIGDIVALHFNSPQEEAACIVETCKALRGVAVRPTR